MKRIICEGEIVPRGYGIAWREWDRDVAVAYPIPLHIVLGWLRLAYIWVRFRAVPHSLDRRVRGIIRRAEQDAYARGHQQGARTRDAFRQGWEAAFAKLEADVDAGFLRR